MIAHATRRARARARSAYRRGAFIPPLHNQTTHRPHQNVRLLGLMKIFPTAVFKTARSGSTWFASLLVSMLSLKLQHEVIRSSYCLQGEQAEHLMRGRLLAGKSFSINPKNAPCVNYSRVVAEVAKARVILFERCNTVKHAISYLRRPLVVAQCSGVKKACNGSGIPEPQTFRLKDVKNAIVCTYERAELARRAAFGTGLRVHTVTYESLQRDQQEVIGAIREIVSPRGEGPVWGPNTSVALADEGLRLRKTGSDSLWQLLRNADEVRDYLRTQSKCLLGQMEDMRGGICTRCENPWPKRTCDRVWFRQYGYDAPALGDGSLNCSHSGAASASTCFSSAQVRHGNADA